MNKTHIPNLISFLRILLVVPIAFYLWQQNYLIALILFLLGGLSDGLDGFLARRYHWQTKLGVILDPMGDKLMLVTSYLLLGWHGLISWWLVSLIIVRDLIIVGGTFLYRHFIGEAELKPLLLSKINTVFQILLVLIVMLSQVMLYKQTSIFPIVVDGIKWLVIFTTVFSGYAYVNEWGKRAWRLRKGAKL